VQRDATAPVSQNTCTIWPASERPVFPNGKGAEAAEGETEEGEGDEDTVEPPVNIIAAMVAEWFLALPDDKRDAFVAEALTLGTFMGEVCSRFVVLPNPCTGRWPCVRFPSPPCFR
jgi:hypothetical protein